jgi:hypothetical protein
VVFRNAWWSVELPPNWRGYPDVYCATFQADPPLGALQISAADKETGIVTDQDMREFAAKRVAPGVRFADVRLGAFTGLTTRYFRDGLFWNEWWLKSGHLMVYATYNVVREREGEETEVIESILTSLANTDGPGVAQ